MSLTVALGQVGFAAGGALAGPLYANVGYGSNTLLGAVSVLGMGVIVWRWVPEPRTDARTASGKVTSASSGRGRPRRSADSRSRPIRQRGVLVP